MDYGAIILCGGKSTRMGRDKATLPFGPETMLQRVVRLLSDVVAVRNIVIVAAANQVLPELPAGITVTHDPQPERGPLEGLAAGLRALPASVDAAYVTSCDVPLLVPEFAKKMFALLEEHSFPGPLPRGGGESTRRMNVERYGIAVPRDGAHHHPLAAAYRQTVLSAVQKLLDADRLRPRFLFDEVPTREVFVDELRDVDPHLDTLKNLNTPEEYQAALRSAGLGD